METEYMKTIEFKSQGFALVGTLHLPEVTPAPMVIGCHGLMADRNSPKQIRLAQACCRDGIGYFRFDHRGCGESQGDFNQVTSLEGRRQDLLDAMRFVRSLDACNASLGLFGSSMGGAVCLSVWKTEEIDVMVTVAAPLHSRFPHAEEDHLKSSFDLREAIQGVKSILIFHGEQDEVVPLSHARELYAQASHPKKLIVQPTGDHRMSKPGHQETFIQESVAWYAKLIF